MEEPKDNEESDENINRKRPRRFGSTMIRSKLANAKDALDHRRQKGTAGVLKVRVNHACDLPGVDNAGLALLGNKTSDPYAILFLEDESSGKLSSVRKTNTVHKTCDPVWREIFSFTVPRESKEFLWLHVEVYDWDEHDDEHTFLGHAKIELSKTFLHNAKLEGQVQELRLNQEERRTIKKAKPFRSASKAVPETKINSQGSVHLEIRWATMSGISNCRLCAVAFFAPQTMRYVGLLMQAYAGLTFFVMLSMRWICEGPHLVRCTIVQIIGVDHCMLVAALMVSTSALVHIAGMHGSFGPTWHDSPPDLSDLLNEETGDLHDRDGAIKLSVAGSMTDLNVSLVASLMPTIPCLAAMLTCWVSHFAGIVFSILAVGLAWMHHGPSTIFAEAAYLDVQAIMSLVIAWAAFCRSANTAGETEWHDTGADTENQEPISPISPLLSSAWHSTTKIGRSSLTLSGKRQPLLNKSLDSSRPSLSEEDAVAHRFGEDLVDTAVAPRGGCCSFRP